MPDPGPLVAVIQPSPHGGGERGGKRVVGTGHTRGGGEEALRGGPVGTQSLPWLGGEEKKKRGSLRRDGKA